MVQRRVDEAAEMMGGTVRRGERRRMWRGAAIDSRRVAGGELFFALDGERVDGHDFVDQAIAAGAAAAVVQRPVKSGGSAAVVEVDSVYEALHRLTREVRGQLDARIVAVTGSAGKTSTKELIATVLGGTYRTAKSPGNLNNLYGFPLSLLAVPDDTQWMVAEMGMSTPGELGQISRLGRPDVVVFTNVGAAHLEFFGSVRAVAEAKAEILEGLSPNGFVIANADDPEVVRIARRWDGRVLWYGVEQPADCRARDLRSRKPYGTHFELEYAGERQAIELPLFGRHHVENFLAAACTGLTLGVPAHELPRIARSLAAETMRGEVHETPGGALVIDDSYNSNPAALERALESARALDGRRFWAVLGEMLELGPESGEFHRRAGETVAELGFDVLLGVGEGAREMVEAAASSVGEVDWCASAAEAADRLAGRPEAGDVVLVKGSRGVGLETVVERLLEGVD